MEPCAIQKRNGINIRMNIGNIQIFFTTTISIPMEKGLHLPKGKLYIIPIGMKNLSSEDKPMPGYVNAWMTVPTVGRSTRDSSLAST